MSTKDPELLAAALECHDRGWAVLPLADKKPLVRWAQYQQGEIPSSNEINQWFIDFNVRQIAVLTGQKLGNIWVADADGPDAVEWLDSHAPRTPVKVRTRKGEHWYFRAPEGLEVRNKVNIVPSLKNTFNCQIDVRGDGGYIVIPPSWHSEGQYEWVLSGADPWFNIPEYKPPLENSDGSSANVYEVNVPREKKALIPEPALEGFRNSTLASYIGTLIFKSDGRFTLAELIAFAKLWNNQNPVPLSDEDLVITVKSIAKTHERNHSQTIYEKDIVVAEFPDPELEQALSEPVTEAPDYITRPGGILEEIIDYITESSVIDFPLFSLGAGLCLIGTLIGQKVKTETGLRTNLYIMALAPSGTGKDSPLKAIPKILMSANCAEAVLGPDQLASAPALWKHLEAHKCQLCLLDEIGDLMGSVNNKFDTAKSGLTQDLKKLFSSTDRGSLKIYVESAKNVHLNWHHLSFYATGTPTAFWSNIKMGDIIDGFISRNLIFCANLLPKEPKNHVNTHVPESLIKSIRALNAIKRPFVGDLETSPNPVTVSKTEEATAYFNKWRKKHINYQTVFMKDSDGIASIYARAPEHASKIALIHAVSLERGVPDAVGLDSVSYACKLIDWTIPKMVENLKEHASYNSQDGLRRRIMGILKKNGHVTARDVYSNIRDCSSLQAKDALYILEQSGELIKVNKRGANGQSTEAWVAADTITRGVKLKDA
ncbi:MAG: bifunctional DNA primase/polymerase [Deltaproteobacteria bacterium]|jgi:hypothetical protein|nr:bifunctional DNA primase/polymerase [Deltaproteobacteria bacterium]